MFVLKVFCLFSSIHTWPRSIHDQFYAAMSENEFFMLLWKAMCSKMMLLAMPCAAMPAATA